MPQNIYRMCQWMVGAHYHYVMVHYVMLYYYVRGSFVITNQPNHHHHVLHIDWLYSSQRIFTFIILVFYNGSYSSMYFFIKIDFLITIMNICVGCSLPVWFLIGRWQKHVCTCLDIRSVNFICFLQDLYFTVRDPHFQMWKCGKMP